jgi:hypothetical protein
LMGLHLYMLFSLPSPVLTAMAHESTHRERFHPGIIKDIQNMIGCWRICEEVFVSADSFLLLIRDGAIFAAGCAVASYAAGRSASASKPSPSVLRLQSLSSFQPPNDLSHDLADFVCSRMTRSCLIIHLDIPVPWAAS